MAGETLDCDVLIVGLGPVGAALAGLLADAGISTISLDRDTEVYPLPRAVHFDQEIMRLFQQMGIAQEVLVHTRITEAYEFRDRRGQVLMGFGGLARPGASGWSSSYMFHQPGLENALRTKLAASANAEIRLAHRFESLVQHKDHVSAAIVGPDGPATIEARYLVGCDGASSGVREAIGGGMDDYAFDEPWLVVDALAPDGGRLPNINLQICDPARPTTCVLSGPGRHRWEFMLLPGEPPEQVIEDDFIRPLIAKWDGAEAVVIERKAVYRFHGLVAKRWRDGRVLLAGDSCHQMPPFAGQGMCSGLRDAANLAWKLAQVIKGEADEALLDTYQTEREPHVRGYIELAIGMGRTVCALDPAVADARDAQMLAQKQAGATPPPLPPPPSLGEGCSLAGDALAGRQFPQPWAEVDGRKIGLDDALGAGAVLIHGGAGVPKVPGVSAFGLEEARLAPFREPIAKWLANHEVQAVLLRPDRYIFGAGATADLLKAYALATGARS
jgi:3-(3-hydroxy-phenyl)propionate hydroxylase